MTGRPQAEFVGDRRYRDPAAAMARFLELTNAAEAEKGRIPIGPDQPHYARLRGGRNRVAFRGVPHKLLLVSGYTGYERFL